MLRGDYTRRSISDRSWDRSWKQHRGCCFPSRAADGDGTYLGLIERRMIYEAIEKSRSRCTTCSWSYVTRCGAAGSGSPLMSDQSHDDSGPGSSSTEAFGA